MKRAVPCPMKTPSQLTIEWDRLAHERHRQIASGKDISFDHVLAPLALSLLEGADTTRLLDIGSGTGDLTCRFAHNAVKVIGVEPSHVSVAVARLSCEGLDNVQFIQQSLESAETTLVSIAPTAAVAAMTLMTAPELPGFARALSSILGTGATFVATIPHPCFWPTYWQYDDEPWFEYSKEIYITAPFVISQWPTDLATTHIHRPLEIYIREFRTAGFVLDSLVEPMPPPEIQSLYPQPWRFPRFVGLRWKKL